MKTTMSQHFKSFAAAIFVSSALLFSSTAAHANTVDQELAEVQKEWAQTMYNVQGKKNKYKAFQALAQKTNKLSQQYPNNAKIMTWEGITLSSLAGAKGGMGALSLAKEARNKLEKAKGIDATVLNGSVYTSLGALYSKVPGWPVGFGSDKKAEAHFSKALAINPNGIDPNYFYAEYLVEQEKADQAVAFLQKALNAPARPNRPLADAGRKKEAQQLLAKIQNS